MRTCAYIYWRNDRPKNDKGEMFANVHILVGYNQCTITDYQNMAKELRKTFPKAKDSELCPGKIRRSDHVDGFTILRWDTYLPAGKYPGWTQLETIPEYSW